MIILIIVFIFLLVYTLFVKDNRAEKTFLFVSAFIFIILRVFVEIKSVDDLEGYYDAYLQLVKVPFSEVYYYEFYDFKCEEIGFRYLLKIGSYLGSFKWALFFIAIIYVYSYFSVFRKYSPFVCLSVILLFLSGFFQSLFVLRQHLAMSILFLAFPYIINRNLNTFLLLFVVALSFHLTAAIFFPVYFFYSFRNKIQLAILSLCLFVFVYMLKDIIFDIAIIESMGYQSYKSEGGANTGLYISIAYFSAFVFYVRKRIFEEGIIKLVFVIFLMNVLIRMALGTFFGIDRLIMYYSSSSLLLIPLLLDNIKKKYIRYIILVIIMLVQVYMAFYGSGIESYTNYKLCII